MQTFRTLALGDTSPMHTFQTLLCSCHRRLRDVRQPGTFNPLFGSSVGRKSTEETGQVDPL